MSTYPHPPPPVKYLAFKALPVLPLPSHLYSMFCFGWLGRHSSCHSSQSFKVNFSFLAICTVVSELLYLPATYSQLRLWELNIVDKNVRGKTKVHLPSRLQLFLIGLNAPISPLYIHDGTSGPSWCKGPGSCSQDDLGTTLDNYMASLHLV